MPLYCYQVQITSLPLNPHCRKHTSGWRPISLESRSVTISVSVWRYQYWAQGSSSSHTGPPEDWVSFPCIVLLMRITKHLAFFWLYIIQNSFILALILLVFKVEVVLALHKTVQHSIIYQSWQQLYVPGWNETRLLVSRYCTFYLPIPTAFKIRCTFNNFPS